MEDMTNSTIAYPLSEMLSAKCYLNNMFNRSKPKMTNTKKAVLTKSSCDKSPMCPAKKACPVGAISQRTTSIMFADYPVIDTDLCIGCGACVDSCRGGAIRMN